MPSLSGPNLKNIECIEIVFSGPFLRRSRAHRVSLFLSLSLSLSLHTIEIIEVVFPVTAYWHQNFDCLYRNLDDRGSV